MPHFIRNRDSSAQIYIFYSRGGASFKQWKLPKAIHTIKDLYLKQVNGDRDFVELLQLIQIHGIPLCQDNGIHLSRDYIDSVITNGVKNLKAPIFIES